jgi:hypothetical protein
MTRCSPSLQVHSFILFSPLYTHMYPHPPTFPYCSPCHSETLSIAMQRHSSTCKSLLLRRMSHQLSSTVSLTRRFACFIILSIIQCYTNMGFSDTVNTVKLYNSAVYRVLSILLGLLLACLLAFFLVILVFLAFLFRPLLFTLSAGISC